MRTHVHSEHITDNRYPASALNNDEALTLKSNSVAAYSGDGVVDVVLVSKGRVDVDHLEVHGNAAEPAGQQIFQFVYTVSSGISGRVSEKFVADADIFTLHYIRRHITLHRQGKLT